MKKPDKNVRILFLADSSNTNAKLQKDVEKIINYLAITKKYKVITNFDSDWLKIKARRHKNLSLVEQPVHKFTSIMKKVDAVVVEATTPSIEFGALVVKYLDNRKPVLVLSQKKNYTMMVNSRYYRAATYENIIELPNIFTRFLRTQGIQAKAERFHVSLSKDQKKHLSKMAERMNLNISEYLRKLIEEDIIKQDEISNYAF